MMYKQWAKGALYLLIQAGSFAYFILVGAADLFGLFTLGTVEANRGTASRATIPS